MRRHSPPYHSPPRRGHGGRGRSPPRRGYGGHGGRKEQGVVSLLVRNIPLSCRPEDLRVTFERFGPVQDVYLPRDYYSGLYSLLEIYSQLTHTAWRNRSRDRELS